MANRKEPHQSLSSLKLQMQGKKAFLSYNKSLQPRAALLLEWMSRHGQLEPTAPCSSPKTPEPSSVLGDCFSTGAKTKENRKTPF